MTRRSTPPLFDLPRGIERVTDTTPVDGLMQGLHRPVDCEALLRVRDLLPARFEAYARVLHPTRESRDGVHIGTWAAMAERQGVELRPETSFNDIVGVQIETPAWDQAVPESGSLPREQTRALASILSGCTSTPDRCWLCIWDGWGWWTAREQGMTSVDGGPWRPRPSHPRAAEHDALVAATPRTGTWYRQYLVFRGPVSAAGSLVSPDWQQSPNMWWPDDLAWCVATEVDDVSTYVGADRACIDRVLANPDLEAIEVDADTPEESPPL